MPSSATSRTSPSSSKIKPGPMARASVTNPRTPPQTSRNRLIVVRQLIVSPSFERNSLILAQFAVSFLCGSNAPQMSFDSRKQESAVQPRNLAQLWRELGEYDDSRVGKRGRSIGEVAIPAASEGRTLHLWSYDRW